MCILYVYIHTYIPLSFSLSMSLYIQRSYNCTARRYPQPCKENYQKVAEESDVQKLMEALQGLLAQGGGPLRQAAVGSDGGKLVEIS